MIRRILSILIVLLAIAISAKAQDLSFEVQANEAKISLAGATEMTALQFNLRLPEGVSVDTSNATLGSATDGHTLCMETLDNGDLLFILYSMDLNTFMDGELLRIPITASKAAIKLYTIRYASTDAVSHEAEDVITGISRPSPNPSLRRGEIYNVAGQMVNGQWLNGKLPRGIYIVGDRKVLK